MVHAWGRGNGLGATDLKAIHHLGVGLHPPDMPVFTARRVVTHVFHDLDAISPHLDALVADASGLPICAFAEPRRVAVPLAIEQLRGAPLPRASPIVDVLRKQGSNAVRRRQVVMIPPRPFGPHGGTTGLRT